MTIIIIIKYCLFTKRRGGWSALQEAPLVSGIVDIDCSNLTTVIMRDLCMHAMRSSISPSTLYSIINHVYFCFLLTVGVCTRDLRCLLPLMCNAMVVYSSATIVAS